ncbi:MAG: tetraacyldisaccharide 4'-kinase [Planctomycetaceae bacterium]|nr:tetraacyldisaccharide 4'-kinase [Planctomycetaceae bacterium]
MDERAVHDILSGRRGGLGAAALRAAMSVAAVPYGAAMRLRRWAYKHGMLASQEADLTVICVGNLTTGGAGKTPMVAWIVRQLQAAGRTPAILTRGYKAHAGLSDEAALLEATCGVKVIVNADRVAGAAAAKATGADVAVMDDGFQHLRLRRDLDIVLIDATCPLGYGRCLPRGLLREPPTALADAAAVIITRADEVPAARLAELRALPSEWTAAPVLAARHKPSHVIDPQGLRQDIAALAGKKLYAFCGIGNPESFFNTLERAGGQLVGREAMDDHAHYDAALAGDIAARAAAAGAEAAITTQKDDVKLAGVSEILRPWQLAVEIDFLDDPSPLRELVLSVTR